jgi:chromosome segregation ATPase
MSGTIGWMLDIIILAALAGTLLQSFRLSRQFNKMQADRKAFEQLIQALNIAVAKADTAIRAIRDAAASGGSALQEKVSRAQALAEELEIIVQAGDTLADRLGRLAEDNRKLLGQPASASDDAPPPRSRAEKELIEALKSKQKAGEKQ